MAVKLLRDLPEGGVERLLDLRDRARRLATLDHRHLVCAHDIARVDARFALVSPWVDGIDLLDWMDVLSETGRVIPRRVSCEILKGVAVALDAALVTTTPGQEQPLGLVHRDLKPSNVLVTRDGELKVTDHGTGYTALAGRSARSGALKKGLVRYLSPERRDGHRAQAPADVYGLGILALELFRGRWLRRLRSSNPAHDRYLADVVARLEDLQQRSDADDRTLRNLLLRMVAHDPEARPEMGEVVTTMRALADRVDGPSLEAFAVDHAVPWLDDTPAVPDDRIVGALAVICERGVPIPEPAEGLPLVTLPDRYELQLQAGDGTGEYPIDAGPEVTDPRLRRALGVDDTPPTPRPIPAEALALVASGERAEAETEADDEGDRPHPPDAPPVDEVPLAAAPSDDESLDELILDDDPDLSDPYDLRPDAPTDETTAPAPEPAPVPEPVPVVAEASRGLPEPEPAGGLAVGLVVGLAVVVLGGGAVVAGLFAAWWLLAG